MHKMCSPNFSLLCVQKAIVICNDPFSMLSQKKLHQEELLNMARAWCDIGADRAHPYTEHRERKRTLGESSSAKL